MYEVSSFIFLLDGGVSYCSTAALLSILGVASSVVRGHKVKVLQGTSQPLSFLILRNLTVFCLNICFLDSPIFFVPSFDSD
ncbi:MAG: hypothetical protein BWY08_01050 [Bacteroidetes bacterium ADurb.Bin174]|jgi:hypothetical protein|nr:MAG: hypothetical protein BWY08_01050 [Bacteroidetes bacterium ADurb.Bin174]